MQIIRYAFLALVAIVLVTLAMANRGFVELSLLPPVLEGLFGVTWDVSLPTFLVILLSIAVGVALGFVWEWIREHHHRAEAAAERRERKRLEAEMKKMRTEKARGDDVLALLE